MASDTFGASGRAMLGAGSEAPDALAEVAKGALHKKIPMLREALTGRFNPNHALVARKVLATLHYLDEAVGRLSEATDELCRSFGREIELFHAIP